MSNMPAYSEEHIFVRDLFTHILFERKIISEIPTYPESDDVHEVSEYSQDIGKAVLFLSYVCHDKFYEVFERLYPGIVDGKICFRRYIYDFCENLLTDDEPISYVWNFFAMLAFVVELSVYCYHRGYKRFIDIAKRTILTALETYLYPEFQSYCGWAQLRIIARNIREKFDSLKCTISGDCLKKKFYLSTFDNLCTNSTVNGRLADVVSEIGKLNFEENMDGTKYARKLARALKLMRISFLLEMDLIKSQESYSSSSEESENGDDSNPSLISYKSPRSSDLSATSDSDSSSIQELSSESFYKGDDSG